MTGHASFEMLLASLPAQHDVLRNDSISFLIDLLEAMLHLEKRPERSHDSLQGNGHSVIMPSTTACRAYAAEYCPRGGSCRFSHEASSRSGICFDFARKGSCRFGDGANSAAILRSKCLLESEGKKRELALLQDQRMRLTSFSSLIPSLIMTVLPLSWKSSIECVISLDGSGMIRTEKMRMRNFARQWFTSSTPFMERTSMTFRRGKPFAKLCEFS